MNKFAKVKKKRLGQKMVKSISELPPTASSYSFHPIYSSNSTPSLHKHDVNSLSYIAPAPATQTYVAPIHQMVTKEQTTSMKSWGFWLYLHVFFPLYALLFTEKTRLQDKENDRRFKKIALSFSSHQNATLNVTIHFRLVGASNLPKYKHSLSMTFSLSGK